MRTQSGGGAPRTRRRVRYRVTLPSQPRGTGVSPPERLSFELASTTTVVQMSCSIVPPNTTARRSSAYPLANMLSPIHPQKLRPDHPLGRQTAGWAGGSRYAMRTLNVDHYARSRTAALPLAIGGPCPVYLYDMHSGCVHYATLHCRLRSRELRVVATSAQVRPASFQSPPCSQR